MEEDERGRKGQLRAAGRSAERHKSLGYGAAATGATTDTSAANAAASATSSSTTNDDDGSAAARTHASAAPRYDGTATDASAAGSNAPPTSSHGPSHGRARRSAADGRRRRAADAARSAGGSQHGTHRSEYASSAVSPGLWDARPASSRDSPAAWLRARVWTVSAVRSVCVPAGRLPGRASSAGDAAASGVWSSAAELSGSSSELLCVVIPPSVSDCKIDSIQFIMIAGETVWDAAKKWIVSLPTMKNIIWYVSLCT
mmetsp:Transcript_26344/g.47752  ORF Transcript_26344/g.47752 Transcript_26344/m.47752 type:complete len:257 (-) Transcript_26344:63-833(-)